MIPDVLNTIICKYVIPKLILYKEGYWEYNGAYWTKRTCNFHNALFSSLQFDRNISRKSEANDIIPTSFGFVGDYAYYQI